MRLARHFQRKKKLTSLLKQQPEESWSLQQRNPEAGSTLPPVYADVDDVVRPPEPGLLGRDRLVAKPRSIAEARQHTTDDESRWYEFHCFHSKQMVIHDH